MGFDTIEINLVVKMFAKHKSRNEYTTDQQIQRAKLKLVQHFLIIVGDSINA